MRHPAVMPALAVGLAALLVVAPSAVGQPASANGAEPRIVDYELGEPATRTARLDYGTAAGDSIPIGTGTSRVVLELTESRTDGGFRGDVACRLYGGHSPSVEERDDTTPLGGEVTKYWSAAEWADPAARFLDIPAGVVVQWPGGDPDDYDRYDLYCESGPVEAQRQVTRLLWRLTPVESGSGILTLTQDPRLLFGSEGRDAHVDAGPTQEVGSGDLVRVSAPVGTWPSTVEVEVAGVEGFAAAAAASADGSVVGFRMPALSPADDGENPVAISVRGTTRVVTGRTTVVNTVEWRAEVRLREVDARASQTTLSLSARYGLSLQRLVATVAVTTPGSPTAPPPSGSVAILVDGRRVATATLNPAGPTRVRLPMIPRGPHRITAQYLGDVVTSESESAGLWFRILV